MTAQASRRFEDHLEGGRFIHLSSDHPALRIGRTLFPARVVDAADRALVPRLLKSGKWSRKIGSHVEKGAWRGMPIYTLTLEERATCPRSCGHWDDCYGNKMNWSQRIRPGLALEARLREELDEIATQRANRRGFVVRLHVLGDFYSVAYVRLWSWALLRHPQMRLYGYTAHHPSSEIGREIHHLNGIEPERWRIRFSDGPAPLLRTVSVDRETDAGGAVVCPAQTGRSDCCGTCALCWATDKPIAFLRH
jgi:hypothetical protein